MSSKTRKFIGPMSLVAIFAVVGALAAFVVLGNGTDPAYAQAVPEAPRSVDAAVGHLSSKVTWRAPADAGGSPITGYKVQHRTGSADYASTDVGPNERDHTITDLLDGTAYDIQVIAVNAVGDSAPGTDTVTPAATVPNEPDSVTPEAAASTIKVSWVGPSNNGGTAVDGYTVEIMGGAFTDWTPVAADGTTGGNLAEILPDPLVVTISGLALGVEYQVRIQAFNPQGESVDYTTATATTVLPDHDYVISSSSSSASSNVELRVEISNIPQRLVVGSSIELYLEDDYQVPDSIPAGAAYFVVTGGATPPPAGVEDPADTTAREEANRRLELSTGSAAPVLTTTPAIVGTDDHFAGDDDYGIQVVIPDLCTGSTQAGDGACDGQNGPEAGQTVTLVISKSAGIKNPTEQKNYKVGGQVLPLGTSTSPNSGPDDASQPATLSVRAKVTLSDDDNTRGYELTITGAGFNNGTTADAYVLQAATAPVDCATLVADPNATLVGSGLVGNDDTVAIPVEVTVPTFAPGRVNHICMVDGENRHSSDTPAADNFDTFFLEPSIRAVPSTVSSGDTVNIFAQDFAIGSQSLTSLKLAGVEAIHEVDGIVRGTLVNGAATSSFEVPGSVGGEPLQGTVRVDARFGDLNAAEECKVAEGCTSEDTKITVTGSELTASVTNVLPNETITITGNGYGTGTQTCIPISLITLDHVAVEVDDDSQISCDPDGDGPLNTVNAVEVSNSGQFVATITLWVTVHV